MLFIAWPLTKIKVIELLPDYFGNLLRTYFPTKEGGFMCNKDKKLAVMMVMGGIIGAGVALLLAPKSGRETREDIGRRVKKVKSQTEETVDDLSKNISDMVDTISQKTDDLLESGKNIAGSARKDLISLIEEGAARLEKFRTKLKRV
jgi:gas vesicle protein